MPELEWAPGTYFCGRDVNDKYFLIFRFKEARDAYTSSLMWCPFNEKDPADNKEYSIILANRQGIHSLEGQKRLLHRRRQVFLAVYQFAAFEASQSSARKSCAYL